LVQSARDCLAQYWVKFESRICREDALNFLPDLAEQLGLLERLHCNV